MPYGYVHREWQVGDLCPTLVEPVMAVDVFPVDTFFSWSPVEGATHYRVFVRAEGETEYTSVGLSTTNSLVASVQLAATTEYQWYVVPLLLVGGTHVPIDLCSPFTSTFTTGEAPSCPFAVSPVDDGILGVTDFQSTFNWTEPPGATEYRHVAYRVSDQVTFSNTIVSAPPYTDSFAFVDGEVYAWYVNPFYGETELDCSANPYIFTAQDQAPNELFFIESSVFINLTNQDKTITHFGSPGTFIEAETSEATGFRNVYAEVVIDTLPAFSNPAYFAEIGLGDTWSNDGGGIHSVGFYFDATDTAISRSGSVAGPAGGGFFIIPDMQQGDVLMFAIHNTDNGNGTYQVRCFFGRNGTWLNGGNPETLANAYEWETNTDAGLNIIDTKLTAGQDNNATLQVTGQFSTTLTYPVPTGYVAWTPL